MVISQNRKVATLVSLVGVISIVLGAFFVFQSIAKSNMITEQMYSEKISYNSADGSINGTIDTPQEASSMALVLKQHRSERYGNYSELKRDDPNRDQILKAMTMENSLNLAVLGYGLTDVVKATGAFMIIVGLALSVGGAASLRSYRSTSQAV